MRISVARVITAAPQSLPLRARQRRNFRGRSLQANRERGEILGLAACSIRECMHRRHTGVCFNPLGRFRTAFRHPPYRRRELL